MNPPNTRRFRYVNNFENNSGTYTQVGNYMLPNLLSAKKGNQYWCVGGKAQTLLGIKSSNTLLQSSYIR